MLTEGRLTVTWTETGGPPVPAEVSEGFGSRLIKATAANQLDGDNIRDWRREGLVIRFTAASSRLSGQG